MSFVLLHRIRNRETKICHKVKLAIMIYHLWLVFRRRRLPYRSLLMDLLSDCTVNISCRVSSNLSIRLCVVLGSSSCASWRSIDSRRSFLKRVRSLQSFGVVFAFDLRELEWLFLSRKLTKSAIYKVLWIFSLSYNLLLSKDNCSVRYFSIMSSKSASNSGWFSEVTEVWEIPFGPTPCLEKILANWSTWWKSSLNRNYSFKKNFFTNILKRVSLLE